MKDTVNTFSYVTRDLFNRYLKVCYPARGGVQSLQRRKMFQRMVRMNGIRFI